MREKEDFETLFHQLHEILVTVGMYKQFISMFESDGVVDLGIGTLLLHAAEDFAMQHACWVIEVTSSSHRQEYGTHDFYLRRGYLKDGSQAYFRKLVSSL